MDAFITITIISAIIAIYSAVPKYRRIRLRFASCLTKIIIGALIILTILSVSHSYIEYHYESILITNFNIELLFLIEFIGVSLTIISSIILSCYLLKKHVKVGNINNYYNIVLDLLNYKDVLTVLTIVDESWDYFNVVSRKAKKCNSIKYKLQIKIDKIYGIDPNTRGLFRYLERRNKSDVESKSARVKLWIYSLIINCIKKRKNQFDQIIMYFEYIILEPSFIRQVAKYKPDLGIKIIPSHLNHETREEFVHYFLEDLIDIENSILYKEIRRNIYLSKEDPERYVIENQNTLLSVLFEDIKIAKSLSIWKPVGEYIIHYLEDSEIDRYQYNYYSENYCYSDNEKYSDPLFVGIRFFYIMVQKAIVQETTNGMWIYYYALFIIEICKNYKRVSEDNRKNEFPNIYSLLIYEIFSNLRSLLSLITRYQNYEKHPIEETEEPTTTPITKECARTIIQSLYYVLITETIPANFKQYISNIVFDLYFKYAQHSDKIQKEISKLISKYVFQSHRADGEFFVQLKCQLSKLDHAKIGGTYNTEDIEKFEEKVEQSIKSFGTL